MSLYCKFKKRVGKFSLDIEMDIEDAVLALLGGSGSGKSMTLRCIAGIEKPDSGHIILDGKTLFDSDKGINLQPQERHAGMLFQDYALFPNMTVIENIQIATSRVERKCIQDLIHNFKLNGLENLLPHQLSGGQRQRCALARMLASEPRLMLLDEPFSALDTYLRWQMEQELAATFDRFGKTVILVSHNRDEVYRLCDCASVISLGKNSPIREKHDLYFHPASYTDALLTGCKNILRAIELDGKVSVPEIGATFVIDRQKSKFQYVGIRSKKILASFQLNPLTQSVNLTYKILKVTESIFSYIMVVLTEGGTAPLYWEVSKETYPQIIANPAILSIPIEDILLLSD